MTFFGKFISWLFLPLFAPVYAMAIGMYLPAVDGDVMQRNSLFGMPSEYKFLLLQLFLGLSAVFPMLAVVFFRLTGTVKTLMMETRQERIGPSIFVNGCAIALFFLLKKLDPHNYLPNVIYGLVIGSFATVFTCTLITPKWKISLHAAGMGILTGFVLCYFGAMLFFPFYVLPVVFIASGIVLSVRLYLKAHDLAQVAAGYALGTLFTAVSIFIYSTAHAS